MKIICDSVSLLLAVFLVGCVSTVPKEALQLQPESLALRQLQTRRFDTTNEKQLLQAGAAVLQDLGFNLDESETRLGVIVASKDRDATHPGQVAAKIMVMALGGGNIAIDKQQKIRASIVTHPLGPKSTVLRITFQRIIWNEMNEISRSEGLEDPILYQEFFEKLSKAVFLEAHNI